MSDTPAAPFADAAPDAADDSDVIDHGSVDHGSVEPVEAADDSATALDLDLIERDLADVELALARLDAGTYWTDEVTGGAIPDELLAEQPTARRLADR